MKFLYSHTADFFNGTFCICLSIIALMILFALTDCDEVRERVKKVWRKCQKQ